MTTPVPPGPFFAADRVLEPEDAKAFHSLEDLLGPYGKPALHQVARAIWDEAENKGYDDGQSDLPRGGVAGV